MDLLPSWVWYNNYIISLCISKELIVILIRSVSLRVQKSENHKGHRYIHSCVVCQLSIRNSKYVNLDLLQNLFNDVVNRHIPNNFSSEISDSYLYSGDSDPR